MLWFENTVIYRDLHAFIFTQLHMLVYSSSFTKLYISTEPHISKENNIVSYTKATMDHISCIFYKIEHNICL